MSSELTVRPDAFPGSSANRQVDWLVLEAEAARRTLANMPAGAPVLLATFDRLGRSESGLDLQWGAELARSLLAQMQPSAAPEALSGPGGLELHPSARLAFCGGNELQLTSTEFALLQELLRQDGAVLGVDGLSRAIWGHDTMGEPNYVEAHISRLRRKLREAGAGRVIETVRGVGYRVRQPRPISDSPMRMANPMQSVDPETKPWREAA